MIKILTYGDAKNSEIFKRNSPMADVADIVSGIITEVRTKGDAALFELTEKFDKVRLSSLAVTPEEIEEAVQLAKTKVFMDYSIPINAYYSGKTPLPRSRQKPPCTADSADPEGIATESWNHDGIYQCCWWCAPVSAG